MARTPRQIDTEDAAAFHRSLATLDVRHREVLVLHFLEEMPVDQVAAVVGCPPGTVKLAGANNELMRVHGEARRGSGRVSHYAETTLDRGSVCSTTSPACNRSHRHRRTQ